LSRILSVLVTGAFGAGKSQFIRTLSDVPVVSTERRITRPVDGGEKATTTVAMDYGRYTLGKDILHLKGTPGQERFDFMWEILGREADGCLFLIDCAAQDGPASAASMLRGLSFLDSLPLVVVANKQDLPNAVDITRIRRLLDLPRQTLIMPCVATRKSSVRQVVKQLVELIP